MAWSFSSSGPRSERRRGGSAATASPASACGSSSTPLPLRVAAGAQADLAGPRAPRGDGLGEGRIAHAGHRGGAGQLAGARELGDRAAPDDEVHPQRVAHRRASGARSAFVSAARSPGASSISSPRRPALTKIVSCSKAPSSSSVRIRLRWPSGLMPPTT